MQLYLDNKNGNVWDLSEITTKVGWKTNSAGKPSTLDISLVDGGLYQNKAFQVSNGDIVRFQKDGSNLFYGYVFSVDSGSDQEIKIKAYDQLRYLLGNDSYLFKNVTVDQVLEKIARDQRLAVGTLEKGEYVIPSLIEYDKKLLDIILKAMDMTLAYKGQRLVLYDDFGKLTLRDMTSMKSDVVLGGGQYITNYTHKRSIDNETYNRIKMYRENKENGVRDVYIHQDSANIAKWGQLQLYQKIDDNWNEAQIRNAAEMLLQLHNREQVQFSVDATGDLKVRSGNLIHILLEKAGDARLFFVEECEHQFADDGHTMKLTLKVV